MAEKQPHCNINSTEALLKRLCFIISEKRQEVADLFYIIMREFLSSGTRGGSRSSNYSLTQNSSTASLLNATTGMTRINSKSDFNTEIELANDQRKIYEYLTKLDKKLARDFSDLFNAIRYDKNVVLLERTAFLRFILKMAKKSEKSDELILDQPKLVLPDFIGRITLKPYLTGNNGKASGTSVEQIFSTNKKNSSGVLEANSVFSQSGSRGLITDSSDSCPSLQRGSNQRLSESSIPGSQSSSLSCKQLVKMDNYFDPRYEDAYKDVYDTNIGISEREVIRYILYTWQGIEGVIFKLNPTTQMYYVDEKYPLEKSIKQKAENLVHLGYLHNRLKKFVDDPVNEGMIRKCLIEYVRNQLSELYNLIAHIGSQSKHEVNTEFPSLNRRKSQMTLDRLKLLYMHPAKTFQDLISILEYTEHFHGGYLASGIYCFIEHGDPNLQCLVKEILSQVCRPLYAKLIKWLLDGELHDPHKEFFIAYNPNITGDRLWHEKYTVRIAMLPEFISVQLANKILSVGKSINFLREICNDNQPFAEKDKIRESFLNTDVEVMYLSGSEDEMERLIEPAYTAINKRVMDVLNDKYSLLSHFQAHRKYLLLGQGDFIHHLMELLGEVLESPADQLHPQHLNGILGSAIRGTTARYENENIINRLDAATLNQSLGDNGWDVFYLRYHVDGPIGTVRLMISVHAGAVLTDAETPQHKCRRYNTFDVSEDARDIWARRMIHTLTHKLHTPPATGVFSLSKEIYQLLFYALTKAKRMEMVLSTLWKKQMTAAKVFRKLPELSPVLRQCNKLTSEMVHFIRQTQYYFLFEILECSWNQLIEKVNQASSLDAVIAAHEQFLITVKSGVFKDEEHEDLSNQLCIIYDLIGQLNSQIEILMSQSQREVSERARFGKESEAIADDAERAEYLQRRSDFVQKFVPNSNINLKILTKTYQDTVKKLLLMLNSQNDLNLQLLSVRLDFNEHYKNLDSRLIAPLTFQHRRLSSMGDRVPRHLLA